MDAQLLQALLNELKELNQRLSKFNQNVFTAREASEYLRIGYDTLLRLTRIGQIEYVPNGSSYLYKKEFLDNWLDKNRRIGGVK